MPSLPGHLFLGRANIAGPVIGGYCCIPFGPYSFTGAQADPTLCPIAIKLPFAFRLERIAWGVRAQAVTGTLAFYSGATLAAQTTNLLAVTNVNMGSGSGAQSGICLPSTEASTPATDTLSTVAGVRTLAKETFLGMTPISDGTFSDLNIQFFGFIMGHPNVLTESD
jgi:hypothetical protein